MAVKPVPDPIDPALESQDLTIEAARATLQASKAIAGLWRQFALDLLSVQRNELIPALGASLAQSRDLVTALGQSRVEADEARQEAAEAALSSSDDDLMGLFGSLLQARAARQAAPEPPSQKEGKNGKASS